MVPTLRDGDHVLFRRRASIRPGDVVVARFLDRPDLLVVKRAVRQVPEGWELASDNPFGRSSSGIGVVEARVLLRLRPLGRLRPPPEHSPL